MSWSGPLIPGQPGDDGDARGYYLLHDREMHIFRSIGRPVLKQRAARDDKGRIVMRVSFNEVVGLSRVGIRGLSWVGIR